MDYRFNCGSKIDKDIVLYIIAIIMSQNQLGQYFTENILLKQILFGFIKNDPTIILEPSIGRGDLIDYTLLQNPDIIFDMYEIDETIEMLGCVDRNKVIFGDFLSQKISTKYKTIIGNPPYIKTKTGNRYIDFIERCFNLLDPDGELIFIVPSDFLKLTSSVSLLNQMLQVGSFTDIFHPHDEHLFKNASIDIIIFRYQQTLCSQMKCMYNESEKYLVNSNGLITFCDSIEDSVRLEEYFDIYVGMVSGKESVFKNNEFGNIKMLNSQESVDSYIYIEAFPSSNKDLNIYLEQNKDILLSRRIKKFNDTNWFQWGAPRNISVMKQYEGDECIYLHNLTRKSNVAFVKTVQYFGGNLIMLKPKNKIDLQILVDYFNANQFKSNFMFSNRFKIGHRQLCNSLIPKTLINVIHS